MHLPQLVYEVGKKKNKSQKYLQGKKMLNPQTAVQILLLLNFPSVCHGLKSKLILFEFHALPLEMLLLSFNQNQNSNSKSSIWAPPRSPILRPRRQYKILCVSFAIFPYINFHIHTYSQYWKRTFLLVRQSDFFVRLLRTIWLGYILFLCLCNLEFDKNNGKNIS